MDNADNWVQPTRFVGEYPNWAGYTFGDWDSNFKVYHPGEDYNFGLAGWDDFGQDVVACAKGIVIHNSKSNSGYGNMVVIKHTLGYNLKRFIREYYGIDVSELYSLYAHLKDGIAPVGMKVDVGQLIGHVGNSGTQYPHLHFEIYNPNGELKNSDWRFYPVGWSKEKIKANYLPAYLFIEATKNMPAYDTFLGKTKDYWEQVEKDRENLLTQLRDVESKWAVRVENLEKQISTLTTQSANCNAQAEKLAMTIQANEQKYKENLDKKDRTILSLNSRIDGILKEQAEFYKFQDALKLVVQTLFKWGNKKEGGA